MNCASARIDPVLLVIPRAAATFRQEPTRDRKVVRGAARGVRQGVEILRIRGANAGQRNALAEAALRQNQGRQQKHQNGR